MINYNTLTVDYLDELLIKSFDNTNKLSEYLLSLKDDELTWEKYVQPQLDHDHQSQVQLCVFEMSSFHPNKEIRDKCSDCSTKHSQFMTELSMRKDLFNQFKKYYEGVYQTEKHKLSAEQVKYIEDENTSYKELGLYLPDDKYKRVKEIKLEIIDLANQYDLNLNNYNKTFFLDLEQLSGLPEKWLNERKQENGKYKVTLKYPDYIPIIENCKVRETRKLLAFEFNNRCADTNLHIAKKTFALRNEMAKLFDHDKFSDYRLTRRMAKNTDTVMSFLHDLSKSSDVLLKSDLETLGKLAAEDGIETLESYDVGYYSRVFTEKQCDMNKEELKKYFPLKTVQNGMFRIYETLLGFKFTEVTHLHKHTFWHDDVTLYEVQNSSDNSLVGHFYLDLYPREGKYGHAAVFTFVSKSDKNLPVAAMACNFSKTDNLTFDFVETFFHEFGHVMHVMCSESSIASLAGTRCERDFVECPSQMFEEWCYRSESLKLMSDGITDDVIEKLNKERKLLQGLFIKRQLTFGLFDMMMHSNEVVDPVQTYYKLYNELNKIPVLEGTCFPASFGHIIHGYESGYYGYLWSKVYAVDMFETKFKGHELDPDVGMKLRKSVLKYGGIRDSLESVKEFLEREPNNQAFIKMLLE